jgi:hypothetical protein
MDWQQLAAFTIVAVATVLLIRSVIRKRKLKKMPLCGGDCNCTVVQSIVPRPVNTARK